MYFIYGIYIYIWIIYICDIDYMCDIYIWNIYIYIWIIYIYMDYIYGIYICVILI